MEGRKERSTTLININLIRATGCLCARGTLVSTGNGRDESPLTWTEMVRLLGKFDVYDLRVEGRI